MSRDPSPDPRSEVGLLPHGVEVRPLTIQHDERGWLSELYRESEPDRLHPVQWNVLHSKAGVLRGVRVHLRNADSVVLVSGEALVGMQDLRRGSPTENVSALLPLAGDHPSVVTIPAGVAHGFYFPQPSILLIGLTHEWDQGDEFGCHWSDPELRIPWPVSTPVLSDRDDGRRGLDQLRALVPPWRPS